MGCGTADFSVTNAMSVEQANRGLELGATLVETLHSRGVNTLCLGEMGIGNTSSASALMGALLSLSAKECVGRGTGINNEQMALKVTLIEKALKLHADKFADPVQTLAAVGGFEIAQITGAMLRAASLGMLIVVDGFIISSAGLLATRINRRSATIWSLLTAHTKPVTSVFWNTSTPNRCSIWECDLARGQAPRYLSLC